MDGGGDGDARQPAADELQHGHLGRGVLHGHAVRPQPQVGAAALNLLARRVVQVAVHDLLRQRERPAQPADRRTRVCGVVSLIQEFIPSTCQLKKARTRSCFLFFIHEIDRDSSTHYDILNVPVSPVIESLHSLASFLINEKQLQSSHSHGRLLRCLDDCGAIGNRSVLLTFIYSAQSPATPRSQGSECQGRPYLCARDTQTHTHTHSEGSC